MGKRKSSPPRWSRADPIELHPEWEKLPTELRRELQCIQNDVSIKQKRFPIIVDTNKELLYELLGAVLEHNSVLTSLDLRYNAIGDAGAASVCSALEHNSVLTSLDLSYNDIYAAGAASVCSALEHNSVLTSLDLSYNGIGAAGATSVCSGLEHNSVLTSLDVSRNGIGEAGATSVCSGLEHNSVLTSLNLSYNGIYAAGAASVCSGLEHNSVLISLDLRGNDIGARAELEIINTLLRRNEFRPLCRLALLSLMDEDYNREEGLLSLTNAFDLVFQNEYIISRMYSYV